MARRRVKKRTHLGANNGPAPPQNASGNREPRSMVIRVGAGEVGPSVSQLVKDVRTMMEPNTASRLKERKSNKLRDFTTMAGPLGVTHLMLFSRSASGNTNFRLALTPRGPTLNFRVEKYSLGKDVKKAMKRPKGAEKDFLTPPLLVMNNFTSQSEDSKVPKHLESLTTSVFQSLFPPISPQKTPLTTIRRVLLLNREPPKKDDDGVYTINLRHYAITTKRTGVSKGIRRLNAADKLVSSQEKKKKGMPNLGKLHDVADYLLDPSAGGYTSASDTEPETDAEVEVLESSTRKVLNKRDKQRARAEGKAEKGSTGVEKRAVKLVELGPRMKLRLTKVEEGVCGGKVMWHEYIHKSKEEVKAMDHTWDARRKEKEQRRQQQKENIERKRKDRKKSGGEEDEEEGEDSDAPMDDYDDEWESDVLDDDAEVEDDEDEMEDEAESEDE
ncbi:putative ribosome biogenesis protein Ssf2 [Xylona heveae TC161]|uniref:Putative ribosome biogenesis protein Ssf2 n=1 Tax=Xylona heveae (strain CBS 132557 / TC161) TaxID=1328760 RepID=A0A164ZYR7_XYLHT|nr:putative ribosome biogenesis protein Ssf2 [Xylona heveae TC161]KZF19713.1 putative ribosome biogenesis protein Ssf2 [Xylona heveae TC161]